MSNLIDLIKEQVTPEVVGQLAKMTGENETQIAGAVAAVVPALVGGALSKSATPAGTEALLDAIGSLGPLDNFASLLGGGDAMHNLLTQGGSIVSSLFGANANQIANGINSAAALHGSSASILMFAAAPLTLSVVGQTLGSDNLNPTALTTLLADQRQSVQAALPAGLGSLVGLGAPEPAPLPIAATVEPTPVPAAAKAAPATPPKPAVTGAVPPPPPPAPSRSIWRWLGPLLLLLLLGGLLWWFLLRPQTGMVPPPAATPAPAAATNTPVAAGAPLTPTVAAESTTMVTATTTATDTTATDTTATDTTATDTTATDTAEVAATGSVTPTAATEASNAAFCTALTQLDLVLDAAPAITTTTAVTDVRSFVGRAGIVFAAVSTTAEGVSGVDMGATDTAVQDLTTAVDGLTGDTLGAAAVPVATALTGVRDSYAELNTAAGCP